jgi:organic radical activating enzyme
MRSNDILKRETTFYKTIVFEIVGYCNAHCPWCPTGNGSTSNHRSRAIPPQEFEKAISNLLNKGLVSPKESVIYLHNWGEPTLHPELNDILHILYKNKIRYSLSTNASKLVNIDTKYLRYLEEFKFSAPGYSQDSYNKIHGLDFQVVRRNIEKYASLIRNSNTQARIIMAYHLYQFNLNELVLAAQFCKVNKIEFITYIAYLMDYNQAKSYVDHSMDIELLRRVSKDVLLYNVEDLIANRPKIYRCPQYDILTIDEYCNVVLCCVITKTNQEYCIGNLFELTNGDINSLKEKQNICSECLQLGIAYWHNTPFYTDFSLYTQLQEHQKNMDKLETELLKIHKSYSWRLTKPIRAMVSTLMKSHR